MNRGRVLLGGSVALLLLTMQSPLWTAPVPVAADSCICFTFVSSPTITEQGSTVTHQIIMQNGYNRAIPIYGYLVIHDASSGGVVSDSTVSATMSPNSIQTLTTMVVNLPPGNYVATFFAQSVDGSVSSSTVSTPFGVVGSQ